MLLPVPAKATRQRRELSGLVETGYASRSLVPWTSFSVSGYPVVAWGVPTWPANA